MLVNPELSDVSQEKPVPYILHVQVEDFIRESCLLLISRIRKTHLSGATQLQHITHLCRNRSGTKVEVEVDMAWASLLYLPNISQASYSTDKEK